MDFSINLEEFITINPSSTELHLVHKTLSNHPATPTPPHLIMSPFLVNLSSIHQVSHWKHVSSTMWTFPYDSEESATQEPMAYISQLSGSFRVVYFAYFPFYLYFLTMVAVLTCFTFQSLPWVGERVTLTHSDSKSPFRLPYTQPSLYRQQNQLSVCGSFPSQFPPLHSVSKVATKCQSILFFSKSQLSDSAEVLHQCPICEEKFQA